MTQVDGTRWVGARVPRKEDRRMLLGRGRFVSDMTRADTLHAAFVRSPYASARITRIDVSRAKRVDGVLEVLTSNDLGDPGLVAVLERDEFKPTRMPMLAMDRVRFVGEPVAVVIAEDAYSAEDGIEAVDVEYEIEPVVMDLAAALAEGAPEVHSGTGNCLVDLVMFDDPALPEIFANAPLVLAAKFTSGRVSGLPMEGRATLAEWDDRDGQVVVHTSTQVPHQARSGIAQALDIPERTIRVIAPDVGGGFGQKCVVSREEVVLAKAAMTLRRQVVWVEDRAENLTASVHGHEQEYDVQAAFDADGRILGLAADIKCDIGAYSVFPFTCAVEPLMAATELPGIYKVPAYRARGRGVSTNKTPTAPYRGVSRPQIVLVMERLMEKAAAQLGIDSVEIRRRNMILPGEFPYVGVNKISYDEGSYLESLELTEKKITEAGWYVERDQLREQGVHAGIGFSCFSERTAYGTPTMSQRRMRMTPGYDTAHVRMDPSGEVIVTTGTCGHGQGHETTFAQIVADQLGVHPDQVRLRQGDTDLTSYGWGTFGSRSIVIGGGAARKAAAVVAEKLRKIAAHMLEVSENDVVLADGNAGVRGVPDVHVPIAELARIVHFQAHQLPADTRYALEARETADPPGTFSNACHAVFVTIDPGTGEIKARKFMVVEDCGVIINPMVVDGQVRGGIAQGIACALYEKITFDTEGQPTTTTLMDYLVPTATEICPIEIHHLETPSQFSENGSKGMGEGGTIGAPAAVLNAVNDALAHLGVEIDHIPVLPEDVLR
ncbi:xanthine dehydrogenase family protein molybdopterin-binding subunit [Actinocrispum wychmicini]|uniref:Carbon-monoxide dehydrogenase large subunit n=1 Tax=Actinocrispum wychmicini TaxID=1213861 RepID=A0A4R2JWD9_9PSEU|nr:xanthine dehydrogenase family protein molybdopterin-binding subunit [Actinocrispum wychmicini]TCO64811.1 carbon-monoxide dehydrogenase large subunit [Actinocrispum wychmicini]